jgi:hypothetical protein
MTDATRPLAGDPAPSLPSAFYAAPPDDAMKLARLQEAYPPMIFHSTLDVADFAPTVPEHEHRWVTEVYPCQDGCFHPEEGCSWEKRDFDNYGPDSIAVVASAAVFCAYPHCPARP